ncbi:hypothetical protein BV898_12732 [Hypsibius exemplaris]|uniref:Uncharacterized protein n=1 Tax=Hypsibius exemplaris TaxID=2072580 RepID=A0A1W0WCX4_HYPEX|nr:hypothetical protein BV898_12732 [Hypsibius exemplaris]
MNFFVVSSPTLVKIFQNSTLGEVLSEYCQFSDGDMLYEWNLIIAVMTMAYHRRNNSVHIFVKLGLLWSHEQVCWLAISMVLDFYEVTGLIPIFSGDKLHGAHNDTISDDDGRLNTFTPWSPCSATCAPAYRVRNKLHCPDGSADAACSQVKSCEKRLPECGSESFAIDIHLLAGDGRTFLCPPHSHEPALRLIWYRWTNDSWMPFQPYDNPRVTFIGLLVAISMVLDFYEVTGLIPIFSGINFMGHITTLSPTMMAALTPQHLVAMLRDLRTRLPCTE